MSELHGIGREGNLLTFYSFNPLDLKVTDIELMIFAEVLTQKWETIREYQLKDDRKSNKIRDQYEKAWRQDKSLLMTQEELDAYGLTYLCSIGGYHVCCCWVGPFNLAFDLTGERSCRVNVFWSMIKERRHLIDAIRNVLLGA